MDVTSLLVFMLQQLGVVLGVGAEAVLVYSAAAQYIGARAGEVPDFSHQALARSARHTQAGALVLVVVSGVAAVLLHIASGTGGVLGEPAFIYKWVFIALVAALFFAEPQVPQRFTWSVRGFAGASWAGLFILHVVAPVAPWWLLIIAHVLFVAVWMALWEAAAYMTRPAAPKPVHKPQSAPVHTSKPTLPKAAPPPPKPVPPPPKPAPPPPKLAPKPLPPPAPVPAVAPKPLPPPPPPKPAVVPLPKPAPPPPPKKPTPPPAPAPVAPPTQKPIPPTVEPDRANPDLPAMRIMPKKPEDIPNQFRSGAVD